MNKKAEQVRGAGLHGWWGGVLSLASHAVTPCLKQTPPIPAFYFQGRECLDFSLPEDPSIPGTPEWFPQKTLSSQPFLVQIHTHPLSNWVSFCSSQRDLVPGISIRAIKFIALSFCDALEMDWFLTWKDTCQRTCANHPESRVHPHILLPPWGLKLTLL